MAEFINNTANTVVGGTADADSIYNSGSNVTINADAGGDIVYNGGYRIGVGGRAYVIDYPVSGAESSLSVLNGGDDDDTINNYAQQVTIYGGNGNDSITNYDSLTSIFAESGNDTIVNHASVVLIDAGTGNNSIENHGSNTTINAETGDNYIFNSTVENVLINTTDGKDTITNARTSSNLTVSSGDGDDSIINYSPNVTIDTGGDKDTIENNASLVMIDSGADNDSINSTGNNVTVISGDGDDYVSIGSGNNLAVSGGSGADYIYNDGSNNALLDGGADKDTIFNSAYDSTIIAGAGDDSILNLAASVTIAGGDGDDTIENGGTAVGSAGAGTVTINGGKGNDVITHRSYSPTTFLGQADIVYKSGDGHDTIYNYAASSLGGSTDTLNIIGSISSTTTIGSDVIIYIDDGSITLKDYAGVGDIAYVALASDDTDADADTDTDSDTDTDTDSDTDADTDTDSDTDADTDTDSDTDTDTDSDTDADSDSDSGGGYNVGTQNKFDIVFLIDNTGSMDTYIDGAKTNVATFVRSLQNEGGIDARLGLVVFGDENDFTTVKYPFTSDVNTFINDVTNMDMSGGGDGPESGLEGIEAALSYDDYREDAQKYFIAITDADFHDSTDTYGDGDVSAYLDTLDVQNDLLNAHVKMDVVGTTWSSQPEWEPLATVTSDFNGTIGKFYDITSDFPTIFRLISGDITGTQSILVNLENTDEVGVFVINGANTAVATLKSAAEEGDTIVGTVSDSRNYVAVTDSVQQIINIADDWNVTATKNNDSFIVNGSNVSVTGGDGNDYISLSRSSNNITLTDLNTSEDDLTFGSFITPGSLSSAVENDRLTFNSSYLNFTLSDRNTLTPEVSSYTVHNGGQDNTIYELLHGIDDTPNPDASHRVQLHSWSYGFNPTNSFISLSSIDDEALEGANDFATILSDGNDHSLWGGAEGDDTLVGTGGRDEFFYLKGNGNDVIENAGDNDLINLLNVSLADIDLDSFPDAIGADSTTIKFNDGGSIKVNGTSQVGFKLADVDCTFCVKDRQWNIK